MNKNDSVQDNEVLYRSVRGGLEAQKYLIDAGTLIILPAAFRDRNKKPSVDRAKLKQFNPVLSKLSETDGIVSFIASEFRAIGRGTTKTEKDDVVAHAVDVIPDPTPENPAHAQIIIYPEFFGSNSKQKNAFKLLQIALATLVTKKGGTLEPSC